MSKVSDRFCVATLGMSRSYKACCVPACTKKISKSYHQFPSDYDLKAQWMKKIFPLSHKYHNLSESALVCGLHFPPSCFKETSSGRQLLKKDAIPTLMLPKPPEILLPQCDSKAEETPVETSNKINERKRRAKNDEDPLSLSSFDHQYLQGKIRICTPVNSKQFEVKCVSKLVSIAEKDAGLFKKKFVQTEKDSDPLSLDNIQEFKSEDLSTQPGCSSSDSVFSESQSDIIIKTEYDESAFDSFLTPGCSSLDTAFSASECKSEVIIKNECDEDAFDIEGRQYAEDLRLLLPEQRDFVRQLVADIMCRARMNILTPEECFSQL